MKRIIIFLLALAALCACSQEKKVMARFVPERSDDFVFENNLIAGRFYGKALEGNPTSPGLDIWVKLPGKLVADEWYKGFETQSDEYYHHDHGGKDCYKVAVSLGGGASSPLIDGKLCYPATNYRSWEIVEESPEKVVFKLHYPQWQTPDSVMVALDKTVTVVPDTYFCAVEDVYTFEGTDTLAIAAGMNIHAALETVEKQLVQPGRVAIWEHASDQTFEPEDGMLGVAVVMPDAEGTSLSEDGTHLLVWKYVTSGQPVRYSFGSCSGLVRTRRQPLAAHTTKHPEGSVIDGAFILFLQKNVLFPTFVDRTNLTTFYTILIYLLPCARPFNCPNGCSRPSC